MTEKTLQGSSHPFEQAGLGNAPFRLVGFACKRGPIKYVDKACTCEIIFTSCGCEVEYDPDIGFCPRCREHSVPMQICDAHGIDRVREEEIHAGDPQNNHQR